MDSCGSTRPSRRPAPPYPPQLRLAPAPPPLNEAEWGRWLLRSREQASRCNKIAAITGGLAAVGLAAALKNPRNPSPEDLARRADRQARDVRARGGGDHGPRRRPRVHLERALLVVLGQTVRQLELEGRRRGYGTPAPAR